MAADQEHTEAQTHLATMYDKGQGVPQEFAEALKWYRKAADQGWARAQSLLGSMYIEGKGVPQDYVLAHKWLNLANAKNRSMTDRMRDMTAQLRDIVASEMTPEQIAEAQRLAREWMAALEERKKIDGGYAISTRQENSGR